MIVHIVYIHITVHINKTETKENQVMKRKLNQNLHIFYENIKESNSEI